MDQQQNRRRRRYYESTTITTDDSTIVHNNNIVLNDNDNNNSHDNNNHQQQQQQQLNPFLVIDNDQNQNHNNNHNNNNSRTTTTTNTPTTNHDRRSCYNNNHINESILGEWVREYDFITNLGGRSYYGGYYCTSSVSDSYRRLFNETTDTTTNNNKKKNPTLFWRSCCCYDWFFCTILLPLFIGCFVGTSTYILFYWIPSFMNNNTKKNTITLTTPIFDSSLQQPQQEQEEIFDDRMMNEGIHDFKNFQKGTSSMNHDLHHSHHPNTRIIVYVMVIGLLSVVHFLWSYVPSSLNSSSSSTTTTTKSIRSTKRKIGRSWLSSSYLHFPSSETFLFHIMTYLGNTSTSTNQHHPYRRRNNNNNNNHDSSSSSNLQSSISFYIYMMMEILFISFQYVLTICFLLITTYMMLFYGFPIGSEYYFLMYSATSFPQFLSHVLSVTIRDFYHNGTTITSPTTTTSAGVEEEETTTRNEQQYQQLHQQQQHDDDDDDEHEVERKKKIRLPLEHQRYEILWIQSGLAASISSMIYIMGTIFYIQYNKNNHHHDQQQQSDHDTTTTITTDSTSTNTIQTIDLLCMGPYMIVGVLFVQELISIYRPQTNTVDSHLINDRINQKAKIINSFIRQQQRQQQQQHYQEQLQQQQDNNNDDDDDVPNQNQSQVAPLLTQSSTRSTNRVGSSSLDPLITNDSLSPQNNDYNNRTVVGSTTSDATYHHHHREESSLQHVRTSGGVIGSSGGTNDDFKSGYHHLRPKEYDFMEVMTLQCFTTIMALGTIQLLLLLHHHSQEQQQEQLPDDNITATTTTNATTTTTVVKVITTVIRKTIMTTNDNEVNKWVLFPMDEYLYLLIGAIPIGILCGLVTTTLVLFTGLCRAIRCRLVRMIWTYPFSTTEGQEEGQQQQQRNYYNHLFVFVQQILWVFLLTVLVCVIHMTLTNQVLSTTSGSGITFLQIVYNRINNGNPATSSSTTTTYFHQYSNYTNFTSRYDNNNNHTQHQHYNSSHHHDVTDSGDDDDTTDSIRYWFQVLLHHCISFGTIVGCTYLPCGIVVPLMVVGQCIGMILIKFFHTTHWFHNVDQNVILLCCIVACPVSICPTPFTAVYGIVLLFFHPRNTNLHEMYSFLGPLFITCLAAWMVTGGTGMLRSYVQWNLRTFPPYYHYDIKDTIRKQFLNHLASLDHHHVNDVRIDVPSTTTTTQQQQPPFADGPYGDDSTMDLHRFMRRRTSSIPQPIIFDDQDRMILPPPVVPSPAEHELLRTVSSTIFGHT